MPRPAALFILLFSACMLNGQVAYYFTDSLMKYNVVIVKQTDLLSAQQLILDEQGTRYTFTPYEIKEYGYQVKYGRDFFTKETVIAQKMQAL